MNDHEFSAAVSRFPWGQALRAYLADKPKWYTMAEQYSKLRNAADTPARIKLLDQEDVLYPAIHGLGNTKRPRPKPKMRDAVLTTEARKRLASIPRR